MECLREKSKRNLTNEQRQAIFDALLVHVQHGKPRRGFINEVAALYSVHRKTISRIWEQGKACILNGSALDVSSKLHGRVGRKRVEIDRNEISALPFKRRSNIRSLAKALEVYKTTIHRRVKEGLVRPHTNALKPYLTEEGKRSRLKFCLSMLEPSSLESQPFFKEMYNYVHIDERWFYLSRDTERYYVLPEEREPHRTCKSKKFITKVMFLAAVARPRFDANGNEVFSGKIGIFPFTCKEPAKRRSKNRAAGTLVTKAITSVTKDVSRSCLIEKVLPAIKAKWPRSGVTETIFIQQDNARTHIDPLDVEFLQAACEDRLHICLSFQPPNSPDMNVLDLGFFRAIQSLQHQHAPATIDELVLAVEKSFEEMPSQSLDHVFLTLQACMVEVMKVHGGNNYKLPHMGKGQLVRAGNLPSHIHCDREVMENAIAHLQSQSPLDG